MKMKLGQKNKMQQKQQLKQRLIIVTAAASITGLIAALIFFFNIGNVRDAFSASTTYYSIASGDWEDKAVWSTSGYNGKAATDYPQAGDIVYISGNIINIKNADAKVKSIFLQQENKDATVLNVQNGRKLTASEDINLASDNKTTEVTMNINGTGTLVSVGKDFYLDKNKGGQGNLNLYLSNGGAMNIAGNMYATYDNGQNDINIQLSDNANMLIEGNIELSHASGNGTINLTAKDQATVTTNSDIVFDNDKKSGAIVQLNGDASLNIGGSIIKDDTQQQFGAILALDQSNVTFFGEAQQSIGGYTGTTGDTFVVNTLIIDNNSPTAPQVKLSGHVKVTGQLQLKDGILQTSATSMLIIADNATSTGGSDSSFVSGPIQKDGNDAFIFPVGKDNKIAPISISAPASSSSFVAEYFKTANTAGTSVELPLTKVSSKEYWKLNRTKGTAAAKVNLYWNNTAFSGILNPVDVKVSYLDNTSKWKYIAGNATTTSPTNGYATMDASVNQFGNFTFGFMPNTPLPVSLLSFDAKLKMNIVQINWATASEDNNDFFTVERSADGKNFEKLATVKGAGTTQQKQNYEWADRNPLPGTSFYRLKQTDFNGQYETFNIKAVTIANAKIESVGPNPFSNIINIKYTMLKAGNVTIQLVNAAGAIVYETVENANIGANSFTIINQQNLNKGIYFLRIVSEGQQVNFKLVKSL